ncbi:hypothetical protein ACJJTC_016814 [Scirpophaga incertulas]
MASRMFLVEAALREECLERRRNRRRLRSQLNITKIHDLEFVGNYRLSRELFEALCQEIIPLLPPKARRHAIEPTVKILTALNFYARASSLILSESTQALQAGRRARATLVQLLEGYR